MGNVQILPNLHRGSGGITKKIIKDHMGERAGGVTKRSQRITITKKGEGACTKLTKLKVLIKEIVTPRINYQWVV